MVEVGLVAYLKAQSSLMALLEKSGVVTICPIPAPEDLTQFPLVTYQVASYTMDYTADGPDGVATKRIVYNCWSQDIPHGGTWLQAHTIMEAVRAALTGYTGTLPDGTQVFSIEIDGQEDFFESESRLYRATLHAVVTYSE